jgi:hypothetical protein
MLWSLTFVIAGFDVESTLDLNLDLHVGHSKIPTRNSGMYPMVLCFAGATVQHLVAVATFVSRFGQSTTE